MIVDAIQSLAQLLTKSSNVQSGQTDRHAAYQMQLTPGQEVRAEVMASLPNQRYLARIAGKLFNIELPVIVQPGETLQLTYLTGEPNLTFTLSKSQNSSSPVNISDAGRLLNQLSPDGAQPGQANALGRNASVLNGPPSDTSLFSRLLGEALSQNGIFYESHLLQWFFGERGIKDILKEPQGKLSRRLRSREGESGDGEATTLADGSPEGETVEGLLTATGGARVDPRLVTIVREQLQTLHTGQVYWHGEVWPRQEMEWSVREDGGGEGEEGEKGWVSTLRLSLPKMGTIAATLNLEKGGVSIRIGTERETASSLMRQELNGLEQAMANAGIRLVHAVIEDEADGK